MGKILYRKNDKVAYITLNRPERGNAIDEEMAVRLKEAFSDTGDDDNVWAILITGKGKVFCTGYDLAGIEDMINSHSRKSGGKNVKGIESPSESLYEHIQTIWKPTVAAVQGNCLAQGAGLACSCDIRIAASDAQIGWPQSRLGIPSTSAPSVLATQIPLNIALEHMYTGETFSAKEALRLCIFNYVTSPRKLWQEAEDFIRQRILPNAPLAIRIMKEVAIKRQTISMAESILLTRKLRYKIASSHDIREGIAAFREKRLPSFQGK